MIDKTLNYGREAIEAFLRQIAPYGNVLDIGAGSGSDLVIARRCCPAADLYAVEAYPPNVAALGQQQIRVVQGDVEREALPFENDFFDVILTNQTMEHVKEVFWILHNVSRKLKVGGHLIVGVPNLASLHNRLLLLCGRQPTCLQNASAHVRGYTRHDFVKTLNKVFPNGYRLEGFRGSNFYPFPATPARFLSRVAPNQAWGIFMLFRKVRNYSREFLEYPITEQLQTNFYLGD